MVSFIIIFGTLSFPVVIRSVCRLFVYITQSGADAGVGRRSKRITAAVSGLYTSHSPGFVLTSSSTQNVLSIVCRVFIEQHVTNVRAIMT